MEEEREAMEVDGEEDEGEEDAEAGEEEGEPPFVQLHPPVPPPLPVEGDRRTPALQRIAGIKGKERELAQRLQAQGEDFQDDYVLMPRLEVLHQQDPLWRDLPAFEQHLQEREGWARELAQGSFRVETGAAEILKRSDVMVGHQHERSRSKHWMWSAGPPPASPFALRALSINFVVYHLVRELLINAQDAGEHTGELTRVDVRCDKHSFFICNDGADLPVVQLAKVRHARGSVPAYSVEYVLQVPSSSTNDPVRERGVHSGGQNGLGAKLVLMAASEAGVRVCDGELVYQQHFAHNLRAKTEPVIEEAAERPSFALEVVWDVPYLYKNEQREGRRRTQQQGVDEETMGAIYKLVYDVAARVGTRWGATVTLNGVELPSQPEGYLALYRDPGLLGTDVVQDESNRFLLAVQWWSRPLPVPASGWGEASPNTCFLDPVPTSGALEDAQEGACHLARKDGSAVERLWGLFNNSGARRQIKSVILQHVTFVFFATVDGRIEWTGQTKSACKENPVPAATVASLFRALRDTLSPLPPALHPMSFSVQEAYNRLLTTNSENRDRQRTSQAAAQQRALHGGELPAFFKGNYFPAPALRQLPELDEEVPPPATLIATEGLSALSAVLGSRDALPGQASRAVGLVGLQGQPRNSASYVRKIQRRLTRNQGRRRRRVPEEEGSDESSSSSEGEEGEGGGREGDILSPEVENMVYAELLESSSAVKASSGSMPHLMMEHLVGARTNTQYSDPAKNLALQYKRLVIMSDADDHGTKITALVLSTLYAFYRSLLTRCTEPPDPELHRLSAPRRPHPRDQERNTDPFLYIMFTPLYCLVREEERKEQHVLNFTTTAEYEAWRGAQSEETLQAYRCERNKGLGSVRDMGAILQDADRLTVPVVWSGRSEEAVRVMLMIGDREAGLRRRGVIMGTDPLVGRVRREARALREQFPGRPFITAAELLCVNLGEAYRNLVFANLPHMHDGLKQTARSILAAAAASSPGEEFKVPALAGLVMQTQGYGHGEASLQGVIQLTASRLRHNFPLLEGLGSFENKLAKEAAQPRYVSVRATQLFRALFPRSDLETAERDPVEGFVTSFPPVLPGILLGSVPGLCAGFRSEIPFFHPSDVMRCVHLALRALWGRGEHRQEKFGNLWGEDELVELGMSDWEDTENIIPRYRDCKEGVFFVNGARMHPARWLGLRRENLNQSRRDYDPDDPLGVGPARVQKLVWKYLVPLALWEGEAAGVSRDELLRLGSDEELTLSRDEFPLTTKQSWTMGTLSPWTYEDDSGVPPHQLVEVPDTPAWPTTCRVTVRGLPPGVSAKEFYAKLDASVFCRVLMDGRHHDTRIDHERDAWTCELTFNVAPLQWMDVRLMELPEVPMYNPLEFGTPSAYLVLLCWRHVPFLFHLHPSFHHAMVGPGPDQITPFTSLYDCVISFCERRLGMYRERHARLVAQREEEVAAQELRVRFYEYMQVLWEEDKSLLRSWSRVQEWLRERAAQRGEEVWVPPSFEDTDEVAQQRARAKLELAREGLRRAQECKAMDLWREDLERVMPLLLEEWEAPVWVSSSQRPQRRGR